MTFSHFIFYSVILGLYVIPLAISYMVNTHSSPVMTDEQTYVLRRNPLFAKLGFFVAAAGLLIGVVAELHPADNTGIILWGVMILVLGVIMMLISTNIIEVSWNSDGLIGPDLDTPAGLVMRRMKFEDIVEYKKFRLKFVNGRQNYCGYYCVIDNVGNKIFWDYSLKGYTALNDEIRRFRPDLALS